MNKVLFLLLPLFCAFAGFSQGLKENQIPFYLNSDSDGLINVIDTDDDEDGTLDNADAFPLDPNFNSAQTQNQTLSASDDAGLRSNSTGTMANNYGSDATVQTKGTERSFIVKWTVPANLDLNTAILTFYTDTENDPLEVYFLPNSSWLEGSITYNSAVADGIFTGQQLAGTTGSPSAGVYTFNMPITLFPASGGEITLLILDPGDPSNAIEDLYTKETSGKTPTIELNYNVSQAARIAIDQSYGTSAYVEGGPIEVGFKLSQAPTSTVWLPFAVSDSTIAKISGDEVLVFDSSNWNTFQTLLIDPKKPGTFDLWLKPLHSNDAFFNGHNPNDLSSYTINAANISNLTALSVQTGNTLDYTLTVQSGIGSSSFDFRILEGPTGLNVVEKSGRLSFRPLSNQIGVYTLKIEVTDEFGNISVFQTSLTVSDGGGVDPTAIYVIPNAAADPMENGSVTHPYNDIVEAINASALAGGGNVFIRGGEYQQSTVNSVSAAAPFGSPVVVKPLTGEHVKINFDSRAAFEFTDASKNIEIQGLEIDGNTDEIDFWAIVGRGMWGDPAIPRGGGICIAVDGDSIMIRNNYMHDAYQKAVEIRNGRYTDIYGNIISHIATTSLSGGHGIMRQQKGDEFFDDDNLADYRWDIYGNLLFNVRQQIYSWVPSKNFMEMTLDEGKPILIDDPKDTNGLQEAMSARIKNNVLAYGDIDHIRLKSTPSLEVSHNSIYAGQIPADGITDKGGDSPVPQFSNFSAHNNAVQTLPGLTGIEIDNAVAEAYAFSASYQSAVSVTGNVSAIGLIKPDTLAGLQGISTTELFVNPTEGNFRINPALSLPATLGVETAALDIIEDNVDKFGVTIKWDGWTNDNLVLTQSILDNIPGVYDAIIGNELVFTSPGVFTPDTLDLEFDVVDGDWKATSGATAHHEFRLNEVFVHWYKEALNTYTHQNGTSYARVRWGQTNVEQDFTFPADWLMISQITSDTNTIMDAMGYKVKLDGDLLVDFEGITPAAGDHFDLVIADSISTANTGSLFDYVQFEGYTPNPYTLEIVDTPSGQALRLSLPNTCTGVVINTNDAGAGSLREAMACVTEGGTITLSSSIANDTIKLTSGSLVFDKNIGIVSEDKTINVQNCTASEMAVSVGKIVVLTNFQVLSDRFTNNGDLQLNDMIFKAKNGQNTAVFSSGTGSKLLVNQVSGID